MVWSPNVADQSRRIERYWRETRLHCFKTTSLNGVNKGNTREKRIKLPTALFSFHKSKQKTDLHLASSVFILTASPRSAKPQTESCLCDEHILNQSRDWKKGLNANQMESKLLLK